MPDRLQAREHWGASLAAASGHPWTHERSPPHECCGRSRTKSPDAMRQGRRLPPLAGPGPREAVKEASAGVSQIRVSAERSTFQFHAADCQPAATLSVHAPSSAARRRGRQGFASRNRKSLRARSNVPPQRGSHYESLVRVRPAAGRSGKIGFGRQRRLGRFRFDSSWARLHGGRISVEPALDEFGQTKDRENR